MLRKAQPADLAPISALRAAVCRETPAQALAWVQEIIGLDNLLVLQSAPPALDAVMAALPVYSAARRGMWLAGLMAQNDAGTAALPRLAEAALRAFAERGYDFVLAVPQDRAQQQLLAAQGFADAPALRRLQRAIPQNLWAQADFDTMTAHRLQEERQRFAPGSIVFPKTTMAGILRRLYSRGLTLVSGPRGYGLYYQGPDKLYFVELQADNDHSADLLLQAVRGRTGIGQAQLLLAESQSLYLGQGKRCPYGMVYFLKKPFPVGELYFRVLL